MRNTPPHCCSPVSTGSRSFQFSLRWLSYMRYYTWSSLMLKSATQHIASAWVASTEKNSQSLRLWNWAKSHTIKHKNYYFCLSPLYIRVLFPIFFFQNHDTAYLNWKMSFLQNYRAPQLVVVWKQQQPSQGIGCKHYYMSTSAFEIFWPVKNTFINLSIVLTSVFSFYIPIFFFP